jgi:hypothetical protein
VSTKKKTAKKKPPKKPGKKPKKPKKKQKKLSTRSERTRARGTLAMFPNLWVLAKALAAILFPPGTDSAVVVKFNDRGKVNHVTAHRSTNDLVWFQNLGTVGRSFDLDHWPFLPPAVRLTVGAGKSVGPFTLNPAGTYNGTITFINIVPPFTGGGGPGDPQFDTGG